MCSMNNTKRQSGWYSLEINLVNVMINLMKNINRCNTQPRSIILGDWTACFLSVSPLVSRGGFASALGILLQVKSGCN